MGLLMSWQNRKPVALSTVRNADMLNPMKIFSAVQTCLLCVNMQRFEDVLKVIWSKAMSKIRKTKDVAYCHVFQFLFGYITT